MTGRKGSLQYSDQDLNNIVYQYYFQVGTGNQKIQIDLGITNNDSTQEKSNQSPDKKKKDEEEKSSNITIIEQAEENSIKAPEKSSEKPLEKTHQDLKVKPVKFLQLKI